MRRIIPKDPTTMAETTVRSFLDRLLAEGRKLAQAGEDTVATRLGIADDPAARERLRETALAGGAVAGLAALLLGGRRRGVGGGFGRSAALLAGAGALGKIALNAWSRRGGAAALTGTGFDRLEGDAAEDRARTLLLAMVAAANADGHVDEEELSAIEAEMEDAPLSIRRLLSEALRRPADPREIAARAQDDQERREVYAASALLCGRDHPAEVAYLDELAQALGLSPEEARDIEDGLSA